MVAVGFLFALLSASTAVLAAPAHQKRIAQVIADSTHDWEQACLKAGGGEKCNPVSVTAFTTLLAAAGNCEQQDAADSMIDLAKTLNNDPEMIRLTQLFVQQPRNAPDSLSVPYCQTAPKNAELNGLFHCEFEGSNLTTFSGDQTGNLPLGVTAVNPPGSCPAFPSGPVPAGQQLEKLVTDPQASVKAGTVAAAQDMATPTSATAASTASATNGCAVPAKKKKHPMYNRESF